MLKVKGIIEIEGVKVVIERVKNTANGSPRFECTVLYNQLAYTTKIATYAGEKEAARKAYEEVKKLLKE